MWISMYAIIPIDAIDQLILYTPKNTHTLNIYPNIQSHHATHDLEMQMRCWFWTSPTDYGEPYLEYVKSNVNPNCWNNQRDNVALYVHYNAEYIFNECSMNDQRGDK